MEEHLAAVRSDGDLDRIVAIGQDADQLGIGACRDDDGQLGSDRSLHRQRAHGDAVVVGRGQRHCLPGEARQHAGQDWPALIGSRGKDDLGEGLAQSSGGDRRCRRLTDGRNHRELVGLDALDRGAAAAARQLEGPILDRELKVDALVG